MTFWWVIYEEHKTLPTNSQLTTSLAIFWSWVSPSPLGVRCKLSINSKCYLQWQALGYGSFQGDHWHWSLCNAHIYFILQRRDNHLTDKCFCCPGNFYSHPRLQKSQLNHLAYNAECMGTHLEHMLCDYSLLHRKIFTINSYYWNYYPATLFN